MTDFIVDGPSEEAVIGTGADDRLIYTLISGEGGVVLSELTPNVLGGYDGAFQTPEGEDTAFTAIGSFTFTDTVGGDDIIATGAGDDKLTGRDGRDILNGGAGDDTLSGGRGADRLYGGDGDDVLYSSLGNDRLYGGTGDDYLQGAAGNDRVFGGAGDDEVLGFTGEDLLYGRTGADELYGQDGNDRLFGGLGKDILDGGNDEDVLRGENGADRLYGRGGDDLLFGGRKADWIYGGDGDDVLTGGLGQDTFFFYYGGADRITDFTDDIDSIEIDGRLLAEGTTAADLIAAAAVVDGDTVLSYGDGHVLTIEGLTDTSLLNDDLAIV